jgi:hypothetical protein
MSLLVVSACSCLPCAVAITGALLIVISSVWSDAVSAAVLYPRRPAEPAAQQLEASGVSRH